MQSISRTNQEQALMIADGFEHVTSSSTAQAQKDQPVEEQKPKEKLSDEVKEARRISQLEPVGADVASPEGSSDEGWQEASTRGRSAHIRQKYCPRKPSLAKLVINNSGPSSSGSANYKTRTVSPNLETSTAPPRTASNDVSVEKVSKSGSITGREDSFKQVKAPNTEAKLDHHPRASGTTRLSSVASKSVSYKEVAISPPGTVLKLALDQPVEAEIGTDIRPECSSHLETSKEENTASAQETIQEEMSSDSSEKDITLSEVDKPSSSSDETQESSSTKATTKRSKLSASALPFNPGSRLSMSHPYNSVAVSGLYDARVAHQTVLPQPLEIPSSVETRVPRGPRSTLYYRTGPTFRRRHGYPNSQNAASGRNSSSSSIMNPHAAEFVPRKAWQQPEKEEVNNISQPAETQKLEPVITAKEENSEPEKKMQVEKIADEGVNKDEKGSSTNQRLERAELARQVLFKFIVKSVLSSSNEAKAETTTKTSEGEGRTGKQMHTKEKLKAREGYKNKKQDTEGFTVVSNRRRNKHQFTNTVPGLYTQQSVCTSVG